MQQAKRPIIAHKPILCVGRCSLDFITVCSRYPTEAETTRCETGYWQRGGEASTMSTVLRQLGADVSFLGPLSDSRAFQVLIKDFKDRGIAIDACPLVQQEPPFTCIVVSKETNRRTVIYANMNFPSLTYEDFQDGVELNDYSWIHFACESADTVRMMKRVWEHNDGAKMEDRIRVSVQLDPDISADLSLANFADYVFINKDMSLQQDWKTMQQAAFGLRTKIKPQLETKFISPAIISTWSSLYACCLDSCDNYSIAPAVRPPVVVDSLGANSTFAAACIYGIGWLRMDLKDAIALATRCVSFKTESRGYDSIKNFVQ